MTEEPITEEEQPEEENLHWSQKPDADPEAIVEVEELSSRLKKMVESRQPIPRRQLIRIGGIGLFIMFLCYFLYMNIGTQGQGYTFVFSTTGIIICLDDLSMARKLGKLRNGEEVI